MSEIQLVLTDFDGTVAEFGKHAVSNAVREAVITCENRGIRVVPVTGRFHRMALPLLELLGFDDLGIFDNGATIQNCKTGEIVWSKWMDVETIKQVARICFSAAHIIDYSDLHEEHEPADNEIELIDQVSRPASHVYALFPPEKIEGVKAQLDTLDSITYYTAGSTRPDKPDAIGMQINVVGADKFHGVNALRDILNIDKQHTLAIGDGDNDVALFKNAEVKVAMGNGTDSLKQQADYIVDTVEQDGFVEAMSKYVLVDN